METSELEFTHTMPRIRSLQQNKNIFEDKQYHRLKANAYGARSCAWRRSLLLEQHRVDRIECRKRKLSAMSDCADAQ